ncbi:MAG: M56 family metallopeptidase [Terracidiphilus sp.]|jgi:beta-lactamase regulating signal transducer with metallopeptidase domain
METASRLTVAYAINALWQLPLLVLTTEIMVRLLGRTPGKVLYRVWLCCLFLALTVPASSFLHMPHHMFGSGVIHSQAAAVPQTLNGKKGLNLAFLGGPFESSAHKRQSAADLPGLISGGALFLYLASVLFALLRLAWSIRKTQTLLHSAEETCLTREVQETWDSCLALFGITRIKLMSSSRLGGPATVTWREPIVLLPAELHDEQENDMTAVFCHELAHVRRRDFLCNMFIEMFGVLIFYHPAFHWIRRRIQETRELACDDMAADAMSGRKIYARSLLRLTQKMLSAAVVPQPDCALGIFEGEILEKRIMNLLENRSKHSRVRALTSLAVGLCLLLGICVLSANLGLKAVNAQSPIQTNSAPAGWFLSGGKPADYQTGVDKTMTQNSQPSAYLKSIVPVSDGFGTLMQQISASDYVGKRVRLRAWVRSKDVGGWAGVWMRVDKEKTMVAFDNMENRAIKGTRPWKQCEVVLDVPDDATGIFFGILLSGSGEVWMNDVSFEIVGKDVPITSQPSSEPALPTRPSNLKFTE